MLKWSSKWIRKKCIQILGRSPKFKWGQIFALLINILANSQISKKFVESDADEELLFNIPFTGNVKLKAIRLIGEDSENHPSKMRLYKNRPSMTFDDTNAAADQEFGLVKDTIGSIEYGTKLVFLIYLIITSLLPVFSKKYITTWLLISNTFMMFILLTNKFGEG